MRLPQIKAVTPGPGAAALEIVWAGGRRMVVDVGGVIERLAAFAALEDPEVFATARVAYGGGGVAWGPVLDEADGEGPIDMSAAQLWRLAGEQAGEIMPAAAFRAWRERHGLGVSGAAEALGLSRRMATYYDSGAWPVPKTVMLACEGFDARHARKAA